MKRINGIQFRAGVEKAGYKIASDLGQKISICWSSEINTAAVNAQGHVMLANVPDDRIVTDALVWKYAGFILHELLHRKWSDFFIIKSVQDRYLRELHNGVEDAWIENRAVREGLTGNAGELLTVLVNGMVDQSLVNVKDWSDTRQYPFSFAVNLRLHGKTVPVAAGHEWIVSEAQKRITKCTSTADTLLLAQWIMDQMMSSKGQDQGQEKDQGQDQGQGEGEGEGHGEGQGQGQGEGEGEGQGEGEGHGEGQGQGEGNGSSKGSEGSNGDDQGEGKGEGAGKKPESAGAAKPVLPSTAATPVEPTLEGDGTGSYGTYSTQDGISSANLHTQSTPVWDISIATSAKLRYEVKRLFENSANDEWQVNRRAGSLNVRALPKVSISDRLFKRRLEKEGVDSAVVVVLDVSGSMFETRFEYDANMSAKSYCYMDHAVKAAAALVDTLSRAGVKVSVQAFGSSTSVLKRFDEPAVRGLEKLTRIRSGGNTNDYQAVRYAHEQLANRPETRKAVFVITDGFGNVDATTRQVRSGEALGISTVGIGIRLDVTHIYPKSITINSVDDIGNASFKQIKLAA